MKVRVWLIGMEHHRIPVLQSELLARKTLNSGEHLVRWRSGGHREHDLVGEFGRPAVPARPEVVSPPILLEIKVPIH